MHRGIRLVYLLALLGSAGIPNGLPVSAASTPRISAAINGNIVLFRVDGSGRQRVTQAGLDAGPVMSPDGKYVAFVRRTSSQMSGTMPSRHRVMLAQPRAGGRYAVLPFSPRAPLTTPGRAALSWQSGAQPAGLSWYEAGNVVWRPLGGRARWVLSVGPPPPSDRVSPIAWSPDGREIAAPTGVGSGTGYPTTLRLVIGHPFRHSQHTITVRFRPGILGAGATAVRGSYPVGYGLTFADNHHLLFGTIARGAGYQLTGGFTVPDTGGIARMVLGTGNGVHGSPPFGPALDGATRFQLSPNKKFIATDPGNHLWISGNVARPYALAVPLGRGCVLSQWTWLPHSSGLAYVTACTIAGAGPLSFRLTLGTMSRSSGRARVLYTVRSRNQAAIDLAPATRCVACG